MIVTVEAERTPTIPSLQEPARVVAATRFPRIEQARQSGLNR
jgi:hypothetical protein